MPFFSRRRKTSAPVEIPLPPEEMRALVGSTDPALFDNPTGAPVFPDLGAPAEQTILDFGCGCGRVARQLIQQQPPPARYVGVDLHAGMIRWCNENLAPLATGFEFHHHDVHYLGFNPEAEKKYDQIPVGDHEFNVVLAISVFTHLTQDQAEPYLEEMARVLAPGGTLMTSWFLFDKQDFPMMQETQNTLFINEFDVRNAVIYDRSWLNRAAANAGLTLTAATPPEVRGHQWILSMTQAGPGVEEIELPEDLAPRGLRRSPQMPAEAHRIGHETDA